MSKQNRIIATAVAVVVVVAGLYFANHYWLAPSLKNQTTTKGKYVMAPAFKAHELGGDDFNLADFRGKVVLLNFWATWCGPCRDEIPGFVEMQRKYGPQGFQIIGISMDDSSEPVQTFYTQFHMNYPVAMGNAKLGALYGGIYGLPTSFLIGRDGRIYDEVPGEVDRARWEKEIETLLAQSDNAPAAHFRPAGESAQVNVETPAEASSAVPGVDLSGLSKAETARFKASLAKAKCTCGCDMSVLECRVTDTLCAVSLKMARTELAKLQKSPPKI